MLPEQLEPGRQLKVTEFDDRCFQEQLIRIVNIHRTIAEIVIGGFSGRVTATFE